ncbi:MAG: class I SAM-dependent methyltransferase [Candidatus Woesearchaeota archaeon]
MEQSKIIDMKDSFTDKSNKDELKYRNEEALNDERTNTIDKWKQRVMNGRLSIIPQLKEKGITFHGNILELGAGMCWLSSELSKIKEVNEIYALEFSKVLLKEVAPHIMEFLNADTSKITRVIGDFYNLDFEKDKFDYVVFDAALHHVEHLDIILSQVEKVLKKDGKIIAIREPMLPDWRKNERESFGKADKEHGVTEMIFTMDEWKKMFNDKGYNIDFISYRPTSKPLHKLIEYFPFNLLNKKLFGNYIFVMRK